MSGTVTRCYSWHFHGLVRGRPAYAIVYRDEHGKSRIRRMVTNRAEAEIAVSKINAAIAHYDAEAAFEQEPVSAPE